MVINNNVYNHLSVALTPQKRNTTHKASELKAVYNNMANHNRTSPLYLLDFSESNQTYIIDLKEAALTLQDTSDVFSNSDSRLFMNKNFHSDNQDCISGLLTSSNLGDIPEHLEVSVNSLASGQTNIGNYLENDQLSLPSGKYSFTLDTLSSSVKFNINVTSDSTNADIQTQVMQNINNKNTGIKASIINEGTSNALMLTSVETGVPNSGDGLHFSFSPSNAGKSNIIDTLGLNNIEIKPANSEFVLNGDVHTSASNHIAINHVVELDFHNITKKPVNIDFVPDTGLAMEQIDNFVASYNKLVDMSHATGKTNLGTRNLGRDISSIADKHKDELAMLGITINSEGKLEKDDNLVNAKVSTGEFSALFSNISTFKDDLNKATERLTIDPVAYINKLIVTYPNKQNKFDTPYTQSLYSGLIYNNYA